MEQIRTRTFRTSQVPRLLGESVEILPKNFLIEAERLNLCYFKNHGLASPHQADPADL